MNLSDLTLEAREALHIICEYGVALVPLVGGTNYAPPTFGIVPTADHLGVRDLARAGLVGSIGSTSRYHGSATLYALTPAGREALGIEVRDFEVVQ